MKRIKIDSSLKTIYEPLSLNSLISYARQHNLLNNPINIDRIVEDYEVD